MGTSGRIYPGRTPLAIHLIQAAMNTWVGLVCVLLSSAVTSANCLAASHNQDVELEDEIRRILPFVLKENENNAEEEPEEETEALDEMEKRSPAAPGRYFKRFGVWKRLPEDELERYLIPYEFDVNGFGKRSPYEFGIGKREPYGFGIGKRWGGGRYEAAKRMPYNFGIGKRWGGGRYEAAKRMPYNFGVGKRSN